MWIPLQHFDSIARLLHVISDPHNTLVIYSSQSSFTFEYLLLIADNL